MLWSNLVGKRVPPHQQKPQPLINEHTVCASAPGKLILFGEHSVVYGQPAVAAALSDLRVAVLVTPVPATPDSNTNLRMVMPDLPTPLDFSLPMASLSTLDQLQAPPTSECAAKIETLLNQQHRQQQSLSPSPSVESVLDELTVSCLAPVVYLVYHLVPVVLWAEFGLEVYVRSMGLPVGAGLGSSAAFSVAGAAAFLQLSLKVNTSLLEATTKGAAPPPASRLLLPFTLQQSITRPEPEHVETIDRYAYFSEILLHGTPSGIDNAISSRGGALLFTKNVSGTNDQAETTMEPLPDMQPPLRIVLVHTHVPRSTKLLVAGVRKLYEAHPTVISPVLDAMGALVRSFCDRCILSGSNKDSPTDASALHDISTHLLSLVRLNQNLLRTIGVSHDSLECVCSVVDRVAGGSEPRKAAAKLTGAGGGGCAMIVLAPHLSPEESDSVRQELEAALRTAQQQPGNGKPAWKFSCFSSQVAGDGVLWISPKEFPLDVDYDDDDDDQDIAVRSQTKAGGGVDSSDRTSALTLMGSSALLGVTLWIVMRMLNARRIRN